MKWSCACIVAAPIQVNTFFIRVVFFGVSNGNVTIQNLIKCKYSSITLLEKDGANCLLALHVDIYSIKA